MQRHTDERIAAAQHPAFVAGPVLADLLSDPMTRQLMAADRVEYRDLEAVLQRARAQLGIFLPTRIDLAAVVRRPRLRGKGVPEA